MRRVDGNDVHLRLNERRNALHRVRRRADRGAHDQPSVLVARRVGILNALFDVLDRDKPFQIALRVYDGKLFDTVFPEDLLRVLERGSDGRGYEVLFGHDVFDRLVVVRFEAQIAVG